MRRTPTRTGPDTRDYATRTVEDFAERSRRAPSADVVRALWLEAEADVPAHVALEVKAEIVRNANAIDDWLVDRVCVDDDPRTIRALTQNQALDDQMVTALTQRTRRHVEEDQWYEPDPGAVIAGLARAGRLDSYHPLAQTLEQAALTDKRTATSMEAAAALVKLPDLEAHRITRLLEADRLRDLGFADALTHPNANLEVWRAAARVQAGEWETTVTLAQIPEARRDPEIRPMLEEAAPQDVDIAAHLVKDAGPDTPERFGAVAEVAPKRAAQLLADPEFAGISYLRPRDLNPLLDCVDGEVRRAAVQQLGRCYQRPPSPEARAEARAIEATWRERIELAIPF